MTSSNATLVLHTTSGYHLILGKSAYSVCVRRITPPLNHYWQATGADNPYTEARLIQLESRLDALNAALQAEIATCEQQIKALPMQLTLFSHDAPHLIPLRFANPYSYQLAYWVANWDTLLRYQLTLQPLYVLDKQQSQRMQQSLKHPFYDLLQHIAKWRLVKVTREDIENNHSRALKARKYYGELDNKIVTCKKRSRFLMQNTT